MVDLHAPLPGDCELAILTATDDNPESLHILRHSAAHVMAEAVSKLYPDTKLAYGPSLEDGFYYDVETNHAITPADFERIETEMRRIIEEDRPFRRYDMPRAEAMSKLEKEGISVEVVDLRSLYPLDKKAILASVKKTGKAVIVHEAPTTGGFGGEIAAIIADEAFKDLKAPIKRVGAKWSVLPFVSALENEIHDSQIQSKFMNNPVIKVNVFDYVELTLI